MPLPSFIDEKQTSDVLVGSLNGRLVGNAQALTSMAGRTLSGTLQGACRP